MSDISISLWPICCPTYPFLFGIIEITYKVINAPMFTYYFSNSLFGEYQAHKNLVNKKKRDFLGCYFKHNMPTGKCQRNFSYLFPPFSYFVLTFRNVHFKSKKG